MIGSQVLGFSAGKKRGFGGRQPPKGLVRARSGGFGGRQPPKGLAPDGAQGEGGGQKGGKAEVAEVVFSGGWEGQKGRRAEACC